MSLNGIQQRVFDEIAKNFSYRPDLSRLVIEQTQSYVKSPMPLHDYVTGLIAAAGSALENLGTVRGLPAQTITIDRRLAAMAFNDYVFQFINGDPTTMDIWTISPDNGIYETKDGKWLYIIGEIHHLRNKMLTYLDAPPDPKRIAAAIAKKDAQEHEDNLIALGLPGGWMRSPQEWLQHPVGEFSQSVPLINLKQRGTAKARTLGASGSRPLSGVRVVDVSNVVANPNATRLLAAAGADVINVNPVVGDWMLATYLTSGWGKRNIRLDLKTESGKARFKELIASADVFLNGHTPGAFDRLGLDEDTLYELNPSLVHAGASFAPIGSVWERRRGFEQVAQTCSGVTYLSTGAEPYPLITPILINDYGTAYLVFGGICDALARRESDGGYWNVEVSLLRNSQFAASFPADNDETPRAVDDEDIAKYLVDQPSAWGTWTTLRPVIDLSHTKMGTHTAPNIPGTSPRDIPWLPAETGEFEVPYAPTALAGKLYGFQPNFGVQDRAEGIYDNDLSRINPWF
ncbi:CoA transferase [Mycobacteroides immunogenum]|uniref:CoA transferase n=1 Tax=Mycobacteroides immunogenum TaxID=83262 RepID=UPI0006963B46|nr:CoA transferase [Mycobacteroides immunogenum]ANO06543.1 hypothetical protein BAB75_27320 [Mycobacteroides immunogenum]MCV7307813.1 CoA transferase [Mycobacteroides immunogenum]ORV77123.1 hypothetical protein AWC10_18420 [Mycobacteroides immunogenum]